MAEMTQQQALALAQARRARAQAEQSAGQSESADASLRRDRERMTHQPGQNEPNPVRDLADARDRAVYRENPTASAFASAVSGVPFVGEYIDEAAGLIGGPVVRDAVRAGIRGHQQENPTGATLNKLGVGVATGIPMAMLAAPTIASNAPASVAGQVLYGAGVGAGAGAIEGAASGFGAGEGGFENRVDEAGRRALPGAALGSVAGVAAPLMSQVGSSAVRGMRRRGDNVAAKNLGVSPEAAEITGRMIRNDGTQNAVRNVQEGGAESMLGDAGPATAGLLDASVQRAGPGGQIAREAIDNRAATATQDINVAFNDAFGAPSVQGAKGKAAEISPKARRLLYERAYRTPIDYSTEAGRDIEALLPRVPSSVIDRANNLMRMENANSAQIMAKVADDGSVSFEVMPDVRQLDYITRSLNDVAKRGDGAGALGGNTNEGRIYAGLSREIRNATKESVPEYRRALDQAASDISMKEARDLGETVLMSSTTRGDLAEAVADMGKAERAKLKQGIRSYLDDTMAKVRRTAGSSETEAREGLAALKTVSDRASRHKLKTVLGNVQADALLKRVTQASRAFELRAATAQNSKTFARQNMDAAIKDITEPGAIGTLLEGSPVSAARKIAQNLTKMTPDARRDVEERITGEIATLLTNKRGKAAELAAHELVNSLNRHPVTAEMASRVARLVGSGSAVGLHQSGTQLLSQR